MKKKTDSPRAGVASAATCLRDIPFDGPPPHDAIAAVIAWLGIGYESTITRRSDGKKITIRVTSENPEDMALQTKDFDSAASAPGACPSSPCSLSRYHYVTTKQWSAVIRHLRKHAKEIQLDDLGMADAFVAAADFIQENTKS